MAAPGGEGSQRCHGKSPRARPGIPGARAGMEVGWVAEGGCREPAGCLRGGGTEPSAWEPSVQGREVWGVGLGVVSGCAHV